MEYRQLGGSSVKASVVTFGAWAIGEAMWGPADENDAIEAIRASIDLGVTSIDTAPVYGWGHSERLVAKAVAGRRDKVQIFTKYGLRADIQEGEYFFEMDNLGRPMKVYRNARRNRIMEECELSLKNLDTDYIDLYQCHWRDHTTSVEETMEAMEALLKQGKIRAAGVSNFSVDEIETARRCISLASNQPPYSMVDRGIEKDILPFCREHRIGVIVYSPLQRGLLTGKFLPDHKFGPHDHRADMPHFKPSNIRRVNAFLQELKPVAEEHNATLSQVVINWTISQPGVTAALVGARNARQARENAGAAALGLASREIARINTMLDDLKLEL